MKTQFDLWRELQDWRPVTMPAEMEKGYTAHLQNCWNYAIDLAYVEAIRGNANAKTSDAIFALRVEPIFKTGDQG